MNGRGREISVANPVNKTISYQTHYAFPKEGARRGRGGRGSVWGLSPGEGRRAVVTEMAGSRGKRTLLRPCPGGQGHPPP